MKKAKGDEERLNLRVGRYGLSWKWLLLGAVDHVSRECKVLFQLNRHVEQLMDRMGDDSLFMVEE
jgi:hypothetical protein